VVAVISGKSIDGWNAQFADLVRREIKKAKEAPSPQREFAEISNAWPVDSAIGGTVAITDAGTVLQSKNNIISEDP
jgi:hypothetical protein